MRDEKSQCINVMNELKTVFDALQIKLENIPNDLSKDLRKCAELMITTGALKADSSSVLLACAEKLLKETAEIDLTLNLQLIKNDLKQLKSRTEILSTQFENDIEHFENIGRILTDEDTVVSETSSGYQSMMNLNSQVNDNQNLHDKVLLLRKEINCKKQILKELQNSVKEFEGLPPNIAAAKKIYVEAKEELQMLTTELEQDSFLNSSTSSP